FNELSGLRLLFNQQHMLPERRNGDMLNQPSTPQPDIPLKTIGP
ncbi:hypothetical protein ACUOFC_20820, partial [Escherichia sp. TWPC-MK]